MKSKQTFRVGDQRRAGILMPVASLPGEDGIGDFGRKAYQFVDKMRDMGVTIWQILPLNPLGFGNSPYQPYSSFAGDEVYINLDILRQEGYLKTKGTAFSPKVKDRIDYDAVRAYKNGYLKEAYQNFRAQESQSEDFQAFQKSDWVYPYAVFIALKKQNDLRCWNEWPKEQQDWILDKAYDISHLQEEIQYQMFLQYMFYKQWKALKEYANERDIWIMGDVPFYVGIDSLDVWQGRENFLLDQDGRPRFIAGVPPDYFSATGQRWGNPIYDWENIEQDGFAFWINRLQYSSRLYDVIRIDHFRAFDTYWKIPASCDTAVEGEWIEAPGYALFDKLFELMPDIQIVAEDLGDLRDEVLVLRDHYHMVGMNIAQFNLLSPKAPEEHQLIYTGTHDNQTTIGWYGQLDHQTKKKVKKKLIATGASKGSIAYQLVQFSYRSQACMAIVPLFDILEMDDRARLNTPGTVGSPNWEWKLESFHPLEKYQKKMKQLICDTKRR